MNMILASIGVFLVVVILLVVILLVAKNFLVPSGNVKLTINGDKELDVASGSTLLNTLSVNGVFLSSACGGKGSCGLTGNLAVDHSHIGTVLIFNSCCRKCCHKSLCGCNAALNHFIHNTFPPILQTV